MTNMRISGLLRIRFIACVLVIGTAAAFFDNPAWAAKRVALVVGNSAYEKVSPLRNPVNDATLVANTLRRLGFDVLEKTDATQQELKSAIRDFGRRLRTAGSDAVGLFYFAGHGVQSGEHNYLIPLGAPIEEEADLEFEAVPARWVLGRMEAAGNALNVVILDACRNNPYKSGFRTGSRGLSRMEAPTGSLIAYSAGPGSVARDGKGQNSPYALALADAMEVSGLKVEEVFKRVRNSVLEETAERQTPWEESSLRGDFYFRGGPSTASVPAVDTQPRPSLDQRAKDAYEVAERIDTIDAYMVVVRQFPGHVYALLAQKHIDKLRAAKPARGNPAAVEAGLSLSADEIRLIQMGLKSEGLDPGGADGKLGPKTRTALLAWQESQGLPQTGRLDKEQATALRSKGESASPAFRIVGGEAAAAGEWPWQVFVKIKRNEASYGCGGSVVAPRWVLTAAHCVADGSSGVVSPNKIEVLAGTQDRRRGGRRIDVTAVRSHSGYRKGSFENDVALLKLARPAGVEAVELPDAARVAAIAPHGTKATVTGWGSLREDGDPADRLMEVELPVVGEQACRAAYPRWPIDHRTLCAGLAQGGKDSCQGDSGGPLVVRDGAQWVQVGVVSTGSGCARPGKYGIYMNVGAFADWLQQNSGFAISIVGNTAVPEPAVSEAPKPEPPAPVASTPASERARKLSRLLGRDFSPNAVDKTTGWTDLHYAAILDLPQVAKMLLDAGMDADARLSDGNASLGERVREILSKFGIDLPRAALSSSRAPLHLAARGNALKAARFLVERGADMHAKDNFGNTPLHGAAFFNALDVAQYLVARGVEIESQNNDGTTPVLWAARGDAFKTFLWFVERGANFNARDEKWGNTALHNAAAGNSPEIARWLFARGINLDVRSKRGATPLHRAAEKNALEVAHFLAERGADVNVRSNKYGWTPLHRAAGKNALEVARLLIGHGANVDVRSTKNGNTPLHRAAYTNSLDVARLLVDHGANVDVRSTKYGVTPLQSAAEGNAFKTFLWLVERGADFNARDEKWGYTALHWAAYGNAPEIAQWLVDRGANLDVRNKSSRTPLHRAAGNNALEVARFLVERGADVHAKDDHGGTPLYRAGFGNAREVAEFLVSRGADVHVKTNDGYTPLHSARGREIAEFLVSRGADVHATSNQGDTPLHFARGREVAEFLVSKGADIDAKDNHGRTPLHLAANRNWHETVEFLVSRSADIHAKNIDGETPLHYAAIRNAAEIAEFLHSRGADINAKDNNGNTPLHTAAKRNMRGETAEVLLSRGADISARDSRGYTPLHLAALEGSLEIVLLLVQQGADVNATDNEGRTPLDLVADRPEAKSGDGQGGKIRKLLQSHGGSCARNC